MSDDTFFEKCVILLSGWCRKRPKGAFDPIIIDIGVRCPFGAKHINDRIEEAMKKNPATDIIQVTEEKFSERSDYAKAGYLNCDFKMFHLKDRKQDTFDLHYHDFNKILIFLQGDVTYSVEGKNYELKPYDLVLIRTGELHRPVIHSQDMYERIIIYISPQFIAQYSTPEYDLEQCFQMAGEASTHVLRIPSLKSSPLFQTVKTIEATYQHPEEYAQELNQRLLFLQLMIHLNRAALHNDLEFMETSAANAKVVECLNYINEHLRENITMDDLAKEFYMSKFHLMHCFKNETGSTIGSYLAMKRLLLAKDYIQDGMTVTQACYECGFHNYSTFFRAWTKAFGSTPTQFLKQLKES